MTAVNTVIQLIYALVSTTIQKVLILAKCHSAGMQFGILKHYCATGSLGNLLAFTF